MLKSKKLVIMESNIKSSRHRISWELEYNWIIPAVFKTGKHQAATFCIKDNTDKKYKIKPIIVCQKRKDSQKKCQCHYALERTAVLIKSFSSSLLLKNTYCASSADSDQS